jgi:hypothetical protein
MPMGFLQFHQQPQPRKIIQTSKLILIEYEANYGLRHIYLDGRQLPPQGEPQPWWYGYSVGRWEGDTLVVETNNLRGAEDGPYDGWLDVNGSPYIGSQWTTSGGNIYYNDGNVGLGTMDPSYALHVVRSSGNAYAQIEHTGTTDGTLILKGGGAASQSFLLSSMGSANSQGAGKFIITNSDGSQNYFTVVGSNGNVGIGTTSPAYKLDVVSGGGTTARFGTASGDTVIVGGGAGKLDTGTIDPPYTIGGTRYATYMAGMTGVKEETTGIGQLRPSGDSAWYVYVIDFTKLEKGSDLWLFYQTTDFGKDWGLLTVLLTPSFEGRVWYEKEPSAKQLTLYGDRAGEVSYRLTASRFDHAQWSNRSTGEAEGFVMREK